MPTRRLARSKATSAIQQMKADYNAVWNIVDSTNISHDGHGGYSYTGAGGSSEKDIGTIRTHRPLDPYQRGGISSFEITVVDTGEEYLYCVYVRYK